MNSLLHGVRCWKGHQVRNAEFFMTLFILAIGVFLRLNAYWANPPLTQDEAWRAIDMGNLSFSELLFSQDYIQPVPAGFALLCKAAGSLGDYREYALRLPALGFGIGALFLFYAFLRRQVTTAVMLFALGLFAIAHPLVNYSIIVKSYSGDVFFAIFLCHLAFPGVRESGLRRRAAFILVSVVSIWFSFSSVFVLAGLGLLSLARVIRRQETWGHFFIRELPWVVSLLVLYFLCLRRVDPAGELQQMWNSSFWPMPFWSTDSMAWLGRSLLAIFSDPLGLAFPLVAAVLSGIGAWILGRTHKMMLWGLLAPLGLALIASAAHRYPFSGRVLLFLAPAFFVLIGQGLAYVFAGGKAGRGASLVLAVLLLSSSLSLAGEKFLAQPRQDIRDVVNYVQTHQFKGDILFLSNSLQEQYVFYVWRGGGHLLERRGLFSRHLRGDSLGDFVYFYHADLDPSLKIYRGGTCLSNGVTQERAQCQPLLPPGRTWVLADNDPPAVREIVVEYLDKEGQRMERLATHDVSLFLYDIQAP